jgi:hypothetical protein
MSTRCTVACTDKLHIYSCCNTGYDIFLCASIADQPREGYNDDIRIGHEDLRLLYDKLKKYFDNGAAYEQYAKKEAEITEAYEKGLKK